MRVKFSQILFLRTKFSRVIFVRICIHPSSEGAGIKRQNDASWFTGGRTDVMQQHREQRRQNTIGGYILNQSFAVMSFPFMSLSQISEEEADPSIFRTLLQHKSIFSTTKAPPHTEPLFYTCKFMKQQ